MATKGRRVDLAALAGAPTTAGATADQPRRPTGDSPPWHHVAPNPLNRRDVAARPEKIAELAESLRLFGQIEPSTVVDRVLFVGLFPEYEASVRDYHYVQVDGARRRAAVQAAGLPTLDVNVKNHLAASKAIFLAATLAANADREDLDPIEEAYQVELLVKETGSNKAAADQLNRSQPWVTHRLNLLKLVPEVKDAVASGEFPVREARELHRGTPAEQLAALVAWRRKQARRDQQQDGDDAAPRSPRPVSAPFRVGDDPVKAAARYRAKLPVEHRRALAAQVRAFADEVEREDA